MFGLCVQVVSKFVGIVASGFFVFVNDIQGGGCGREVVGYAGFKFCNLSAVELGVC